MFTDNRISSTVVVIAACFTFLSASSAGAAAILNVNYSTVSGSQGSLIVGPVKTDFMSGGAPLDRGDLTNSVYYNSSTGLYTYTHLVDPNPTTQPNGINRFFASSDAMEGLVTAGWLFTGTNSAAGAGGAGTSADFLMDDTFNLIWSTNFNQTCTAGSTCNGWRGADPPILFFFQSIVGPKLGAFEISGASGVSFVPAPEPGSMVLFGTGLLALGVVTRRLSARKP